MTNKDILADLLRTHKRVTLKMMFAANIGYTGRNRVGDLKREGWVIDHYSHNPKIGETPSDNAYILVSAPPKF